jgi:hypothetical protein
MERALTLIERLMRLGVLWAEANGRSPARLATIVANDGKLFDRLAGGATCTIATFERFIVFLRDPANWPAAGMPDEATGLLGSVEMSAAVHAGTSEQEAA